MTSNQYAPSAGQPRADPRCSCGVTFRQHATEFYDGVDCTKEHPHPSPVVIGNMRHFVAAEAEVESLKQQLAAAQAERDHWEKQAMQISAAALAREDDRDQLRAQVEELRQRASDYEAAEGTAIAQRNAALNEALGYKYQAETMREALKNYGQHRRFSSCTWYSQRVGEPPRCTCGLLAALDAATAGQHR